MNPIEKAAFQSGVEYLSGIVFPLWTKEVCKLRGRIARERFAYKHAASRLARLTSRRRRRAGARKEKQ